MHSTIQCLKWTLIVAALTITLPVAAFNPQPEPPGSVAVIKTVDQSIAVHTSYGRYSPRGQILPEFCSFRVDLVVSSGETLFLSFGRLSPGETFSMNFADEIIPLFDGERLALRAFVFFTSHRQREREACAAASRAALEVFDTETGRSSIVTEIRLSAHPPDPI